MPIPHAERAEVEVRKLRDYCLNPLHDEGKHKARLFAAVGFTATDADTLREILLTMVRTREGRLGLLDAYGQRYVVDLPLEWRGNTITIRSAWILEHGSDVPRLTTCYPL